MFDNVREFVLYVFAHAVPEVVPFLVFARSGGAVPLQLTVLQGVFGTTALTPAQLLLLAPFPVIVWEVDELARWVSRRRAAKASFTPQGGTAAFGGASGRNRSNVGE